MRQVDFAVAHDPLRRTGAGEANHRQCRWLCGCEEQSRRCRTAGSVMKSFRLMGKSITANNQMRENHHSTENINIFSLRVININHNLSLVVRNFYVVFCKLEFQFSYKSH